jgi:thiol-disulfide isomerase/thioredoxin
MVKMTKLLGKITPGFIILLVALIISIVGIVYYFLYSDSREYFHREGIGNRLVMYKVDWCPHCRNAKPAFEDLMKEFNHRKDIELMIVDCEEHQDRCEKSDINSYPTFLLEKEDGTNVQYRSVLTPQGVADFLSRSL